MTDRVHIYGAGTGYAIDYELRADDGTLVDSGKQEVCSNATFSHKPSRATIVKQHTLMELQQPH